MKRFLGLFLTIFTLLSLFAVPAFAYADAATNSWPSEWRPAVSLNFKDATALPLQSLKFSSVPSVAGVVPEGQNDIYYGRGAGRLVNENSLTQKGASVKNAVTAESDKATTNNGFVSANGSTMDFSVKFKALQQITAEALKVDATTGDYVRTGSSGTVLGHTGFVVDVHSIVDYLEDGAVKTNNAGVPYSTQYYISFVKYNNTVKNTNAAVIFTTKVWSGRNNLSYCPREIYFCNLDIGDTAQYHRYTFTTDLAATGNKVKFYIDAVEVASFSAPMWRAHEANLGDYVKLGVNSTGYSDGFSEDGTSFSALDVSLDQFNLYGQALTPKDTNPCVFEEEAPLYTAEFLAAHATASGLTQTDYSKKSWATLAAVLAELTPLPTLDKDTVTQAQLDDWTKRLNEAMDGLRFNRPGAKITTERVYIPFSFYSATDPDSYAYVWTNSTLMFTNPDYDIAEYRTNNSQLIYFTSIVCSPTANTATLGEYHVDAVYPSRTAMADRTINRAPTNDYGTGFILYLHLNTEAESKTSASRYSSQFFADHNAQVAAGITAGMTVTLENTTIQPDKAATLNTSGEWLSRYDPQVVDGTKLPTSSGLLCERILAKYPLSPEFATANWRDVFDDFETDSAIAMQIPNTLYFDDYNAANGKAVALNQADYTPESWAALTAAKANIDVTRSDLTQDMLDDWADALNAATTGLVRLEQTPSDNEGGSGQTGDGTDTGDHTVLFFLCTVAVLAIVCGAVLVIGRRRGNL